MLEHIQRFPPVEQTEGTTRRQAMQLPPARYSSPGTLGMRAKDVAGWGSWQCRRPDSRVRAASELAPLFCHYTLPASRLKSQLHRKLDEPGQVALIHCARNAAEVAVVDVVNGA